MQSASLVLVVLSAGFAPAPFPPTERKADLRKMQGTWAVESYSIGGRKVFVPHLRVVIAYERLTFRDVDPKSKNWTEWPIRVDARQRPKNLDLQTRNGAPDPGIYRLKGNTLTICISFPGHRRPTGYEGKPGQWLLVLKRLKR
jgi:uncharacterized protein (TIGR03067 family)